MKDHEKMFERMKTQRAGWNAKDFRKLYEGFGFHEVGSGRDTKYAHPKYPILFASVSRGSGELSKGYAADAVILITKLKSLLAQDEK